MPRKATKLEKVKGREREIVERGKERQKLRAGERGRGGGGEDR